jgi:hypothetical protein
MNLYDLTIPMIDEFFDRHQVMAVFGGEWLGFSGEDDPGFNEIFITRTEVVAADLIGILLLEYAEIDEVCEIFFTKDRERRHLLAASAIGIDPGILGWMNIGWNWLSCGYSQQYDYPIHCQGECARYGYRFGLSATKRMIGAEREHREAYKYRMRER